MPYIKEQGLSLHYTDMGDQGAEPIITLHGLSESGLYWTLPGVVDDLVRAGYRVINMDMRGHGLSRVTGEEKGYDIDTLAADIQRLADYLSVDKFHLLAHATGGMVSLRYAMRHSQRLLSVMGTDTCSSTLPSDEYAKVTDPNLEFPKVDFSNLELGQTMLAQFRGQIWEDIFAGVREHAKQHMYFNRMHEAVNPESAFAMYEACARLAEPDIIADFMASFYGDPDPKIADLRNIHCPVLMLLGEYDVQFIKPAELVAREVPNCKHVVLKDRGHMLAFEDPESFTRELLDFLQEIKS